LVRTGAVEDGMAVGWVEGALEADSIWEAKLELSKK
jgi:hypothetical protein